MGKCTHDVFIQKLKLSNSLYLNKEFEVISIYKDSKTKIKIKTKYGICEVLPTSLIRGYTPTIDSAINKNKYFENKSKDVHGDKYDYSLVDYKGALCSVTINCKQHGKFIQKAYAHLQGRGCMKCHLELTVGWNWKTWESKGHKSLNFDSFKLYIIKCWSETEEFYKIGRTFTDIKRRFKDDMRLPYEYEIIEIIEGTAKEICKLETRLKKENTIYKYKPNLKFKGYTECYRKIKN